MSWLINHKVELTAFIYTSSSKIMIRLRSVNSIQFTGGQIDKEREDKIIHRPPWSGFSNFKTKKLLILRAQGFYKNQFFYKLKKKQYGVFSQNIKVLLSNFNSIYIALDFRTLMAYISIISIFRTHWAINPHGLRGYKKLELTITGETIL